MKAKLLRKLRRKIKRRLRIKAFSSLQCWLVADMDGYHYRSSGHSMLYISTHYEEVAREVMHLAMNGFLTRKKLRLLQTRNKVANVSI